METDRNLEEIHPREDALGFRIFIHRGDGRPVTGARLKIQLKAPDTPWLGSTDFPVVEGTALLKQELDVKGASYSFQFVPPIRGTYTLSATVEPLPGDHSFTPTEMSWDTTIHESPARKKNLGILLAILVTVGGVSGFIIGRPRHAMTLVLLFLLWPHSSLKAHGSHHHSAQPAPPAQTITSAEGRSIDLDVLTPEPRVGELTSLMARYRDAKGQARAAGFHLEIMQLEHAKIVFTTDITAADGLMRWQGQMFDGSPHRISVTALPLAKDDTTELVRVERDLEVTGVEPPLRSVIKSFGLLMFVTAFALVSGLILGRSLPHKRRLT
jgi:hypothetical protein